MLEIIQTHPKISIVLAAFIVSFFISLINYFVLDKDKMHSIKARQKAIQDEMKQHKENPGKMLELNKELMSQTGEMMKHSFKPMLITFLPIIIFFSFIKNAFIATELAKSWIWWYIISSIFASIIFRKLFKLP